jgi:hypothetical protein
VNATRGSSLLYGFEPVIGPVSKVARTSNGGSARNTCVLPVSFSVNHTCLPSGVAAMFGENGEACLTVATIWWVFTSITFVSGVKLEQTNPYFPSGRKIVMPGPFPTGMRSFSSEVLFSRSGPYNLDFSEQAFIFGVQSLVKGRVWLKVAMRTNV